MRSKTPLALMEQVVMILVFALAAALCIQVFVFADQTSRHNEARDRAVLEAQNAAEALKHGDNAYFGDVGAHVNGNAGYTLAYDANWRRVQVESDDDPTIAYRLTITDTDSGNPYLWTAEVTVQTADGELLFSLPVAGQNQEVGGDA